MADNGIGMEADTLQTIQTVCKEKTGTHRIKQTRTGIGLRSVIKRLQDYYGDHVLLAVESSPETGTVFTIYLEEV